MDGEFVLTGDGSVTMSADTARRLLGSGSGDATLLYLYLLTSGGRYDPAGAARASKSSPRRASPSPRNPRRRPTGPAARATAAAAAATALTSPAPQRNRPPGAPPDHPGGAPFFTPFSLVFFL